MILEHFNNTHTTENGRLHTKKNVLNWQMTWWRHGYFSTILLSITDCMWIFLEWMGLLDSCSTVNGNSLWSGHPVTRRPQKELRWLKLLELLLWTTVCKHITWSKRDVGINGRPLPIAHSHTWIGGMLNLRNKVAQEKERRVPQRRPSFRSQLLSNGKRMKDASGFVSRILPPCVSYPSRNTWCWG